MISVGVGGHLGFTKCHRTKFCTYSGTYELRPLLTHINHKKSLYNISTLWSIFSIFLLTNTQFAVKLSGDCRCKWVNIRFGVAVVRCTPTRERFVAAVVDLVNCHTLVKGHRSRWCLLQCRTYTTKRCGRLVGVPIPYIHYQETWSSSRCSNTVHTLPRDVVV